MPDVLMAFVTYTDTIRGRSEKTAEEYFLDIRMFLRYVKAYRCGESFAALDDIDISDVDISFLRKVTTMEIYEFLLFLSREREQPRTDAVGVGTAARARKLSSIKTFFKYLCGVTKQLDENPAQNLESPKLKKSLPRYLTLEQSGELLDSVDGRFASRDYCILTFFLNCGLRVSELVGLNLSDIRDGRMTVTGKGNKERLVYLNDACAEALKAYLPDRSKQIRKGATALFISKRGERMSVAAVQNRVKLRMSEAGIDTEKYSAHKLRHTAATLMYQNGVDVLTLQELLGHENLNTTKIYTHLSDASLKDAAERNPLAGRGAAKPHRQPDESDGE